MVHSLADLSQALYSTLSMHCFWQEESWINIFEAAIGPHPSERRLLIHWMWSLHILSPPCCVFRLMSSFLGPRNLLGPWHLRLYSGYPHIQTPFQITDPLYFSSISSNIWTNTPFYLLHLSPFQNLLFLYFSRFFSSHISIELYHPHIGLPSPWVSYGLWVVSWVFQSFIG